MRVAVDHHFGFYEGLDRHTREAQMPRGTILHVYFDKNMRYIESTLYLSSSYIGDDPQVAPEMVPDVIKDLVLSMIIERAIKKDPSLTEVDTREVWRVAAPMVMDILGAVWGE